MTWKRLIGLIAAAGVAASLLIGPAGSVPAAAYDGCPNPPFGGAQTYALAAPSITYTVTMQSGNIRWELAAHGYSNTTCFYWTAEADETGFGGHHFTATYTVKIRVWTCGTYRGSFGGTGTNSAGLLGVTTGAFDYGDCGLQADNAGSGFSSPYTSPSSQAEAYLNF